FVQVIEPSSGTDPERREPVQRASVRGTRRIALHEHVKTVEEGHGVHPRDLLHRWGPQIQVRGAGVADWRTIGRSPLAQWREQILILQPMQCPEATLAMGFGTPNEPNHVRWRFDSRQRGRKDALPVRTDQRELLRLTTSTA